MRLSSGENISTSLASPTSLTRRKKCDILSSLRVWQFVSLAFARLTNKQSHYSQREISVRLKILARFSQDSSIKISNDSRESRNEIFSARLARRESCYEISFCDTRKKQFSLRNFVDRLVAILAMKVLSVRLTRRESRY